MVRTPPLEQRVLPGVMRRWVIGACGRLGIPVCQEPLPREELERADEVFLTNSIQTVAPLVRIEGRTLPAGPIAARLIERYSLERFEDAAAPAAGPRSRRGG